MPSKDIFTARPTWLWLRRSTETRRRPSHVPTMAPARAHAGPSSDTICAKRRITSFEGASHSMARMKTECEAPNGRHTSLA